MYKMHNFHSSDMAASAVFIRMRYGKGELIRILSHRSRSGVRILLKFTDLQRIYTLFFAGLKKDQSPMTGLYRLRYSF